MKNTPERVAKTLNVLLKREHWLSDGFDYYEVHGGSDEVADDEAFAVADLLPFPDEGISYGDFIRREGSETETLDFIKGMIMIAEELLDAADDSPCYIVEQDAGENDVALGAFHNEHDAQSFVDSLGGPTGQWNDPMIREYSEEDSDNPIKEQQQQRR